MTALELMKKRYSVRKYKDIPVEQEKLDQILEAGRVSPTANNQQPYHILVVSGPEAMAKVAKATPYHHGAPMVLLVLGNHNEVWVRPFDNKHMVEVDTSIVTTQMMLEATELGLGTCWVTYFDPGVLRQEFDLPDHLEPMHILTVGYADDAPKSPDRHGQTRKGLENVVLYQKL